MFRPRRTVLSVTQLGLAVAVAFCAFGFCLSASAGEKVLLAEGLNNPESAVVGEDGRIYVTITGKPDSGDDGQVVVIEDGKATVIAEGMSDPRGIDNRGKELFIADKMKVWHIDENGKASVYIDTDDFPVKPRFLNDVEVGPDGNVYVSDSGSFTGNGAIFRITPNKEVTVVCDTKTAPAIKGPNGLLADGKDHMLLADVAAGKLYRVEIANGKAVEIASGLGAGDGIARDAKGRIYIGDVGKGKVFRVDAPDAKPVLVAEGFKSAADISMDAQGRILVPNSRAGTLTALVITE